MEKPRDLHWAGK